METKIDTFTEEEMEFLKNFAAQTLIGEMAQVDDLKQNCDVSFQYAKTHSVYIKDWEKVKAGMEENLRTGNVHSDFTPAVYKEMIHIADQIVEKKLKKVRNDFEEKFGEPIYNYLDKDGKTKSCFGVVLLFGIVGGILTLLA
ncbi:MAG TPA: hypothetical protein PK295_00150 [Candidatus Magasanikbacteria bacterium]|nr:hypothetical protein [Candidatus Magasanikbacteria bacterium]